MDTKKLRFFLTLAETGNMRAAAELLHISHAGLSKAIHTLEDELATPLITKDGRGIRITPVGRNLIRKFRNCLVAEEALFDEITGIKRNRRIRIGTFEVFSTYLSAIIVRQFEKGTEITFQELIPGAIETEIGLGNIDFGISYIAVPNQDLDHHEVTKIRMGLFAGRDFPSSDIPFEELPFVIPITKIESAPTRVKGLDGWPDDRLRRKIRFTVSLMETALALVRDNLAVGYFPKFIAELHNRFVRPEFCLRELSLPQKISGIQPVYAIKRRDAIEDPQFKTICRVLRRLK